MALRRAEARAWLPALSAPVTFLALLVAMWGLNKASLGGDSGPASQDAPLWRWMLEANNAFWGAAPFSTADGARPLTATVASAAVILVVGYLATWRAFAGLRAGSSAWPGFLSAWMVLILTSVLGSAVWWLISVRGRVGFDGAGQAEFAVLTNGLQYGAKYGWIGALIATLLWMLVRPAPLPSREAAGQLGPPTPYPREREEFFRSQPRTGGYQRDAEADETEPDPATDAPEPVSAESDRLAALRAQVDAEAEEEHTRPLDPYEPRPNPTPASLLDQHRREPAPAFTRDPGYAGDHPPAPQQPAGHWQPAPETEAWSEPEQTPVAEDEPEPYVGRRARTTYDPRTDIPSAKPPYGSHRAPEDD